VPPAGGTQLTITGTNLVGLTSAHVGAALAKNLTCSSATSCTVVTPGGSGTQDITVTDAAGTSAKTRHRPGPPVIAPLHSRHSGY
jgi:IPT/TIG domain